MHIGILEKPKAAGVLNTKPDSSIRGREGDGDDVFDLDD